MLVRTAGSERRQAAAGRGRQKRMTVVYHVHVLETPGEAPLAGGLARLGGSLACAASTQRPPASWGSIVTQFPGLDRNVAWKPSDDCVSTYTARPGGVAVHL